jgi:hypothetical protein
MTPKKKLQNHWQISILIATVFLAACTSQMVKVVPSPNRFPTSTQVIKTSMPIPTQTLRPTATITATPTIDIIAALASEFDVPPICLFSDRYLISKDQNWIGADCKLNREVIITNKSTRDKITIPFLELDSENASCFSIRPLRWSNDNQYFYFTGRCYEQYGGNEMGSLYQVDINNKAWNILIHADHYPYYYFSEDGDQLVYVNQHISGNAFESSIEIGMVDISLGKNKRLVLSDYFYNIETPADHAWSKSSDKFAIILNNSILNEMRAEEVALIVNFNKMDMWLVEDFSGINLLVNE